MTSCTEFPLGAPLGGWTVAVDVVTARTSLREAVQKAVEALAGSERMEPVDAAHSVAAAGALILRAACALEDAAVFEAELGPFELTDPGPDVPAGVRVRALRESLKLSRGDLAHVAETSESSVRNVEVTGKPYRERMLILMAHGLAVAAHPGQIDPDGLAAQLIEAAARDGILSPTGEYDDIWIERRMRRLRARDGEMFRRKQARRRFMERL